MAAATVSTYPWGYRVTGGTDATSITASPNMVLVKSFLLFPGTGSDTAAITDGAGNAVMTIKGSSTAGIETQVDFDARINGLKVTLASATDIFLVIVG